MYRQQDQSSSSPRTSSVNSRSTAPINNNNDDRNDFSYKDHPYEGEPFLWNLKQGQIKKMTITSILRNLTGLFRRKLNFQNALILLILILVFLTYINVSYLVQLSNRKSHDDSERHSDDKLSYSKRKYALYGRNVDSGYLKHVIETFEALGYGRTSVEDKWDVLWSQDHPFRVLKDQISSVISSTSHKINHFPGSGFFTNKMNLATSELPYVPKAFELPKDKEKLLKYAKENPHKRFVQKSNNHRGIKIEKLEALNLSSNNSFIQEYISNPLLVDGHMFDIGVYTMLTSINPLRVYIHNDVLLRFCPEQYHPFDSDVVDKYVVGDDYLPIWKVPSLRKIYEDLGFGMKDTFNAWYNSTKKSSSDFIWAQVEAAIRTILLKREKAIYDTMKKYSTDGSTKNYFEMVRFDFVIDDDGKVYIMEANMSPNLSSAHFPPNQLLYRQVLYNLFKLVGLAELQRSTSDSTQVSDKNLEVFAIECSSTKCLYDCEDTRCSLCHHCVNLNDKTVDSIRSAFLEHTNEGDCLRVFPPTNRYSPSTLPGQTLETFSTTELAKVDQIMVEWFRGKCQLNRDFC